MGGGKVQASSDSYYLSQDDHTDKWLNHKPAEKTNKTLFSYANIEMKIPEHFSLYMTRGNSQTLI